MTTSRSKSRALKQVEKILGGPLTFGLLLRSIREGEAWSLAAMGEKLGVTRAHVAAIENGKPVSPEAAARYAKKLGYSAKQFVRFALQDELTRVGLKYEVSLQVVS